MSLPDLDLARRFLRANPPGGQVLLCAITGSHHYGFPSPDSDLDMKGIHLAPTADLLGLSVPPASHDCLEFFEGIECDLTTNEAAQALSNLLRGNGNMLERISSPFQLVQGPDLDALQGLARGCISQAFYGHYRGYFAGMCREHDLRHRAKTALYVYRVALTGVHLLETGEVVADLTRLAPLYGFDLALGLVERKRAGDEKQTLSPQEEAPHLARWPELAARLDLALQRSPLPQQADPAPVEAWLVQRRLASLGGRAAGAVRAG